MPLVLEPGKRIKAVLESDKGKDAASRPYFLFRTLSCREDGLIMDLADSVDDCKKSSDAIAKMIEVISIALVGWGNMKDPVTGKTIEFDLSKLDEIITLDEAKELLGKMTHQGLEEDELKNSESQSA